MIRFQDYECSSCGTFYEDVTFNVKVPFSIKCPCGQRATRYLGQNQVRMPGDGELYGRYQPAFGCVVRDRQHKHQLLREYGAVELDNGVKGNAKPSEETAHCAWLEKKEKAKREESRHSDPVGWVDRPSQSSE